jgi:hypothetical protein
MKIGPAHDPFQNNTCPLHVDHFAGLLIDDVVDSPKHSVNAAAIWNHLSVEKQAPVSVVLVEGCHDLLFAPHLNEFPW